MQAIAVVAQTAQESGGGGIGSFLPLILIGALIFFIISSQRRRQRTHQQTQAGLAPGTLVVTTSGLYGTVVEIDDGDLLLEVAPDVVCRFARGAVARIVSSPDGAATAGEAADEDSAHEDSAHERAPDAPPIDMTKKPDGVGGDGQPGSPPSDETRGPGDAEPGKAGSA